MKREQWKSQFGFLLAAVGSAIGLGNIWRFSYMAYSNGGGAFLIPYIAALFTAGIPLLILEFGIGHERIGSAPLAYAKISRRWEWLGWWAVIFVMFGIELYYTVVIAWCINFFTYSFNLEWGADPNTYFFKDFLSVSTAPSEIGQIRTPIFAALIIVWFTNWFILYRGVQRGVELANKIFMPFLLLLTAILVFWSITLNGAVDGIKAYLTPDFTRLSDPKVWIDAYSQIFFTLSLGFGIMIAYASYLPEKANITKNSILTAVINCGYSLFAGFAVFSVLGFMAVSEGKPIQEVVSKSIGLAFVAYPKAVSMIPGGNLFGAIFFLCLVVAGLSSSISIGEAFVSALVDKFAFRRKPVVTVISILGFLGSIIFTTQAGLLWLDIVDHFLTHYGLVVVGIFECILVGCIPLVLVVILAGDLYSELTKPYEGYSWASLILIGRDWVLLTLVAAFILASRPWKTEVYKSGGRTGA
jgi:NSS family neurotransmitter:Na+ symporter